MQNVEVEVSEINLHLASKTKRCTKTVMLLLWCPWIRWVPVTSVQCFQVSCNRPPFGLEKEILILSQHRLRYMLNIKNMLFAFRFLRFCTETNHTVNHPQRAEFNANRFTRLLLVKRAIGLIFQSCTIWCVLQEPKSTVVNLW